jgi:hypothetical protein
MSERDLPDERAEMERRESELDELEAHGEVIPVGEGVEGEIVDLDPRVDPELKAELVAALAEADEDARAGRFLARDEVLPRRRLAG